MTLITFEDGKPLMKEDGKIGTEQACCCGGGEAGCCCVGFFVDEELTTRAACEAAGGDWIPGHDCTYRDIDTECLALVPGQFDWVVCLSGWPNQAVGSGPGNGPFVIGDDLWLEQAISGTKQGLVRNNFFPDRFGFSDALRSYQLTQRCGLWHLSLSEFSSKPDWYVTWSFSGFIKPVDPASCDPSGTVTGPMFWSGANGSGSQTETFTVELGDCQ